MLGSALGRWWQALKPFGLLSHMRFLHCCTDHAIYSLSQIGQQADRRVSVTLTGGLRLRCHAVLHLLCSRIVPGVRTLS